MARKWNIRPPKPQAISPADLTLKEQIQVLSWRTGLDVKEVAKRYRLSKSRINRSHGNLAPVIRFLNPGEKCRIVCARAGIQFTRNYDYLPRYSVHNLDQQVRLLNRYRLR